jgi:ELWxxDGT repeat protein
VFFTADAGVVGNELWKSDGTSAGTQLVKDIHPSGSGFLTQDQVVLAEVNGSLFFRVNDGNAGFELWKSDGTSAGTVMVEDIWPGSEHSYPRSLTNVAGTLYFAPSTAAYGREPWTLEVPATSTVTGRHLFYNRSAFDDDNASINASDDSAIAPDKSAYLPGDGLAEFDNVSSYSRGVNGIMIDLVGGGTHGAISLGTIADDFVFKVGNNNTPSSWAAAPAPNAVSVRANFDSSGTDRVVITWADGAIKNQWLEVQVLPTSRTGLTSTDVFFWGNKVGDIGSPTPTFFTTSNVGDALAIVSGGLGPAGGITNLRDIDRDNAITAAGDRAAAIANTGAIVRINIATAGPFAPDGDVPHGDTGVTSALAALSASPAEPAPTRLLPEAVANRSITADQAGSRVEAYFRHWADLGAPEDLADADGSLEALLDALAAARR